MNLPAPAQPSERALLALLYRLLYDTALAIAWKRLEDYRRSLSRAEGEDIAQDAILCAVQNAGKYDSARGTLEAWFSAIVRHKAVDYLRRRNRLPAALAEHLPDDLSYDAPSPEEYVSRIRLVALAEFALGFLPPEERRAVILHDIEELSFAAIAAREGISVATAHARYQRGMAKARERVARPELHGTVVPPDVAERIWRRVAPHINLEDFVEAQPPPSGRRLREPGPGEDPPSSRPPGGPAPLGRLAWLYKLGPLLAVLLGPSGPPMPPSAAAPHQEPAPMATAAMIAQSIPATVPGPIPAALVPAIDAPRVPSATPRRSVVALPRGARRDHEMALLDQAREALTARNLSAALAALLEHARLSPGEQGGTRRAALWAQVCPSYQRTRGRPAVAELEARCSLRP